MENSSLHPATSVFNKVKVASTFAPALCKVVIKTEEKSEIATFNFEEKETNPPPPHPKKRVERSQNSILKQMLVAKN